MPRLRKVTEGVTVRMTVRMTESEGRLLALLMEDPAYTYQELANRLGISRKTVSEKIKVLKEKEVIERIGSAQKGYWKISDVDY